MIIPRLPFTSHLIRVHFKGGNNVFVYKQKPVTAPRAHGPGPAILTWGWNTPGTARLPGHLVSFGQALLSGEMDGMSQSWQQEVGTCVGTLLPPWEGTELSHRWAEECSGERVLQSVDRKQRLPCCDSFVLRRDDRPGRWLHW